MEHAVKHNVGPATLLPFNSPTGATTTSTTIVTAAHSLQVLCDHPRSTLLGVWSHERDPQGPRQSRTTVTRGLQAPPRTHYPASRDLEVARDHPDRALRHGALSPVATVRRLQSIPSSNPAFPPLLPIGQAREKVYCVATALQASNVAASCGSEEAPNEMYADISPLQMPFIPRSH